MENRDRVIVEEENSLKEYNITLKGDQVTSMNRTTAWEIDGVLKKLGVQLNFEVEAKASRESKQSLVFHIVWE